METKMRTKKQRYKVTCPACGKITSSDSNDKPFSIEIMKEEHKDTYDKIVRCPRCDVWFGVFR